MNVIIRDADALSRIRLEAIAKYLRRAGWRRQEEAHSLHATAWVRQVEGHEPTELLVPDSEGYRDYAHRIAELLADLSRYERRSQLAIFRAVSPRRWRDRWVWLVSLLAIGTLTNIYAVWNDPTAGTPLQRVIVVLHETYMAVVLVYMIFSFFAGDWDITEAEERVRYEE
jgi:hypothetical protein